MAEGWGTQRIRRRSQIGGYLDRKVAYSRSPRRNKVTCTARKLGRMKESPPSRHAVVGLLDTAKSSTSAWSRLGGVV